MPGKALIAGATGLVGGHLLKLLEEDPEYNEIIVITRKPIITASQKVVQHSFNFDHLEEHKEKLKADDIFCCLGTTMKKAGSKQNFHKVDFTYVVNLATIASENNSRSFNLVSAMAANKKSIFFYNKVKGEAEEALSSLKFKLINIARPSLIIGERIESRPFEKISQLLAKYLAFIFSGPLKRYTPIEAGLIAKALLKVAKSKKEGLQIIKSDELILIGKS